VINIEQQINSGVYFKSHSAGRAFRNIAKVFVAPTFSVVESVEFIAKCIETNGLFNVLY